MNRVLHQFARMLGNLVFPPTCVLCETRFSLEGREPSFEKIAICDDCLGRILVPSLKKPRCSRCSAIVPLNSVGTNQGLGCMVCRQAKWKFESITSLGNYEGLLRDSVIDLKKSGLDEIAIQLGKLLAITHIESLANRERLDAIVYVPTQWRRNVFRFFNQAELIADGIAAETKIPVADNFLEFQAPTEKQGMLSHQQRVRNLKGTIATHSKLDLSGRTVLLVDDVITSGATCNEASRAMIDAGVKKVFVATIARGVGVI